MEIVSCGGFRQGRSSLSHSNFRPFSHIKPLFGIDNRVLGQRLSPNVDVMEVPTIISWSSSYHCS